MRNQSNVRKQLKLIDISQYHPAVELFKARLHDQNLREKSIISYTSNLIIFFAWCVLYAGRKVIEAITYDDYRNFLQYLDQDKLAPRTVNVYIATLKKFHYFVRGKNWNHYEIPFRRYDSTLPAVPSIAEALKITRASARSDSFDFVLVTLLLSTGARISEICDLTYKDIHRDQKTIYLHPGKGRIDRYVPLDEMVLKGLEDYCRHVRDVRRAKGLPALTADTPIFLFKDYMTPADTNLLRRHFKKTVKDAGLGGKGYNPHSCRHFFALNVYLQHNDLALVKNLLGHKTLNATEVYLRLAAAQTMTEKGYVNPLELCVKLAGEKQ